MWQQEFTWFFALFHHEFRKGNLLAFEVLMALAFAHFGCWLRRWDYSNLLASEPDVKVSLHPAQAWNNAPGCACSPALTGRGFDTVRPLACTCLWQLG